MNLVVSYVSSNTKAITERQMYYVSNFQDQLPLLQVKLKVEFYLKNWTIGPQKFETL
jgi:hypothetical protein